ncbi:MAG: 3-hydroxyacyl-CoA dehydrogenase family protein [bacterium]
MSELVLIVGAGSMGAGIAQVCAQAGREVVLVDISPDVLESALRSMRPSLEKLAQKGRLSETPGIVLRRIRTVCAPDGAPPPGLDAAVAIEAVPEDPALKRRVLTAIEAAVPSETLIGTNTSGIRITSLAEPLAHPGRFLGLHFFNPPVLMRAVEVVRGEATTDETMARAAELVRGLGKDPVLVQQDLPGFVLNRISMTASNEAIRLVQDGVGTAEDIDRGVKGAFGWRMGPLETADLIGLDVVLAARSQIFEQTGDPRFEPPELLRRMVKEGRLGRKSGRGFYDYGG